MFLLRPLQRVLVPVFLAGGLLASAWAQVPPGQPPSVSSQPRSRPAPARLPAAPRPESQPTWADLTPAQRQSLAPLAATWPALAASHKRKWIALSANYATMPPAEQALLHSRMAEWAALSPRQRTLARLNFAETRQVAPDDRKAKWEAYQALPPEEKRRLAAGAAAAKPPPPPTAPAARPVPQQKLVRVPKPKKADNGTRPAPARVDRKTLLPRPAPEQP